MCRCVLIKSPSSRTRCGHLINGSSDNELLNPSSEVACDGNCRCRNWVMFLREVVPLFSEYLVSVLSQEVFYHQTHAHSCRLFFRRNYLLVFSAMYRTANIPPAKQIRCKFVISYMYTQHMFALRPTHCKYLAAIVKHLPVYSYLC